MADLPTFNIADIFELIGEVEGIPISVEGVDDVCNGFGVTADKSLADVLGENRGFFNYLVLDGNPIRVVRRALADDLVIDFEIDQNECIPPTEGAASVQFDRIDPLSLPGEVESQYIDPDRALTNTSQFARYRSSKQVPIRAGAGIAPFGKSVAANTRLRQSVPLSFVIDADAARAGAYSYLYRMWSQAQMANFIHPDLRIEGGDTIRLNADAGIFTLLAIESKINPRNWTNRIRAVVLLTSFSLQVSGGRADSDIDEFAAWLFTA